MSSRPSSLAGTRDTGKDSQLRVDSEDTHMSDVDTENPKGAPAANTTKVKEAGSKRKRAVSDVGDRQSTSGEESDEDEPYVSHYRLTLRCF